MLAGQQEHPATPRAAGGAAKGAGSPTIHGWSVVGYDRVVGLLRTGSGDRGKAIMTSPVLRISFIGKSRTPVALTQSGSLYALGEPAEGFGAERARHFLDYKAADARKPGEPPTPRLPTAHMKLEA